MQIKNGQRDHSAPFLDDFLPGAPVDYLLGLVFAPDPCLAAAQSLDPASFAIPKPHVIELAGHHILAMSLGTHPRTHDGARRTLPARYVFALPAIAAKPAKSAFMAESAADGLCSRFRLALATVGNLERLLAAFLALDIHIIKNLFCAGKSAGGL